MIERLRKYVVWMFAALCLSACQEESVPSSLSPSLYVHGVELLSPTEAFLSGSYDPMGTESVTSAIFHYGTTENMEQSITARLTGRTATAILEGLQAGTTYYDCLEIGNGADSCRSEMRQFTTEAQKRVAALKNATLISVVEAQLGRSFQKEADGTVLLDNPYNLRMVEMITTLDVSGHSDPTVCDEIGYFINLENLDCSGNSITSLSLANNLALEVLRCAGDVVYEEDANGDLQYMGTTGVLVHLDVSHNVALKKLYVQGNLLAALDVSANTSLLELDCNNSTLTSLDVSHCPNLQQLNCDGNRIDTLDVSGHKALTWLRCTDNKMRQINVSGCNALTYLATGTNNLSSIDISDCTQLAYMDCDLNDLDEIDISNSLKLQRFICAFNHIATLDISKHTNLTFEQLYIGGQTFRSGGAKTLELYVNESQSHGTLPHDNYSNENINVIIK